MDLPITEPGVYELTATQYHSDPVAGRSLSSSGARLLTPPNPPARFAYEREHGRPDTAAFDDGHAAHRLVLGVGEEIVVIPFDDWRTNKAKEAVKEARAAGATPMKPKAFAVVQRMAEAVREHPVAGPLFARPGVAEQVLVWQDKETGVWCRAMVDWTPDVAADARILVVDYKTTTDAEPGAFGRSMAAYGYHQQGPFYCDGFTALGLDHGQEPLFVLVAQEKTPPYLVSVVYPDAEAVAYGRALNQQAREIYRDCTDSGHWPGYSTEAPVALSLPTYLTRQYDDMIGDPR